MTIQILVSPPKENKKKKFFFLKYFPFLFRFFVFFFFNFPFQVTIPTQFFSVMTTKQHTCTTCSVDWKCSSSNPFSWKKTCDCYQSISQTDLKTSLLFFCSQSCQEEYERRDDFSKETEQQSMEYTDSHQGHECDGSCSLESPPKSETIEEEKNSEPDSQKVEPAITNSPSVPVSCETSGAPNV